MNRATKRFFTLLLALLLIGSLSVQAFAVLPPRYTFKTGTKTLNLNGSSGKTTFTVCFASGEYTSSFLDASKIVFKKGTSDATMTRLYYKENKEIKDLNYNLLLGGDNRKAHTINYYVTFTASKAGVATLSYKYEGKTYTLKLKIDPYANRIKSITLTGVNSGKSFASLTKSYATARKSLALPATTKNAVLRITPAGTNKILKVEIKDLTSGATNTYSFSGGVTSFIATYGTLNVSHKYMISVVTTGDRTTTYNIVGAKAK